MPQPKKKRSKYDEQKKLRAEKRAEREGAAGTKDDRLAKRRKLEGDFVPGQEAEDLIVEGDAGDDFISFGTRPEQPVQDENHFYGLLEPEEQEYYANVNNKITANDFESKEDLQLFVDAVYRESTGKELKLASSQSCSRYLEKLIRLSTPEQLRHLFAQFLGSFTYLVQHRFGSHCCETLFAEAAKHVSDGKGKEEVDNDNDTATLEKLFLQVSEELQPNMGFLLTDRFASHTVRVLLLVLSGESLDDQTTKTMLASKKKESIDLPNLPETKSETSSRTVPKIFKKTLSQLIASAISTLDTTYLRALATHPTGNPVLQLLLRLEMTASNKGKGLEEGSLFHKLMPDESLEADTESAKFVSGLMYDPTGSHLVETLVRFSPGRIFKKLYKNIWKERVPSMARNDIASYVAIRILERLGKDDLAEVRDAIVPEIKTLVDRKRIIVVKTLVDRCVVRDLDLKSVATALEEAYGDDKSQLLPRMLTFDTTSAEAAQQTDETDKPGTNHKSSADIHGSLLAQSMLQTTSAGDLIRESLLSLPTTTLLALAQDRISSRVIQTALTASPTTSQPFRKQFIPRLYPDIATLALHPVGSFVIDALWDATSSQHFLKENVARELSSHEADFRGSICGRNVWRNWNMDLYKRRRGEWAAIAKGLDDDEIPQGNSSTRGHEFNRSAQNPANTSAGSTANQGLKTVVGGRGTTSGTGANEEGLSGQKKKTPIQLARERHAQEKAKKEREEQRNGAHGGRDVHNSAQVVPASA